MKAIAIVPTTGIARLVKRPEPSISAADEVKMRVVRVGICGRDREETSGGRSRAPDDRAELVIGHEMLGRVVEVGIGVTRVRPDVCRTGDFRERGIWGLDGYQVECRSEPGRQEEESCPRLRSSFSA